jgi:hypothetical protein
MQREREAVNAQFLSNNFSSQTAINNQSNASSVALPQAHSGAAEHKMSSGHDVVLLRLQFLAFRRMELPSSSASESTAIIRNVSNYRKITTSRVSLPNGHSQLLTIITKAAQ